MRKQKDPVLAGCHNIYSFTPSKINQHTVHFTVGRQSVVHDSSSFISSSKAAMIQILKTNIKILNFPEMQFPFPETTGTCSHWLLTAITLMLSFFVCSFPGKSKENQGRCQCCKGTTE